jgi:hypothetical protein
VLLFSVEHLELHLMSLLILCGISVYTCVLLFPTSYFKFHPCPLCYFIFQITHRFPLVQYMIFQITLYVYVFPLEYFTLQSTVLLIPIEYLELHYMARLFKNTYSSSHTSYLIQSAGELYRPSDRRLSAK